MPLYDYKCDRCEKELEVIERVNNMKPTIDCPCGGTMKRVFKPFFVRGDIRNKDPRTYLDYKGPVPDHDTSVMDKIKAFEKEMRSRG